MVKILTSSSLTLSSAILGKKKKKTFTNCWNFFFPTAAAARARQDHVTVEAFTRRSTPRENGFKKRKKKLSNHSSRMKHVTADGRGFGTLTLKIWLNPEWLPMYYMRTLSRVSSKEASTPYIVHEMLKTESWIARLIVWNLL